MMPTIRDLNSSPRRQKIAVVLAALLFLTFSALWLVFFARNLFVFEVTMVKAGIGWLLVGPLSRVFFALLFGACFWGAIYFQKNWFWMLGSAFFLILAGEYAQSTPFSGDEWSLESLFELLPFRVLFYLVLIGSGLLLAIFMRRQVKMRPPKWVFSVLLGLCLIAFLALGPLYVDDYTNESTATQSSLSRQKARAGHFSGSGPVYLFYLSTSCHHCYVLYHKLAATADRIPPDKSVQLVFQGSLQQIYDMCHGKAIPFSYVQLPDSSFFRECGPRLPSAFSFSGNLKHYWTGDQFNYIQLNRLSK